MRIMYILLLATLLPNMVMGEVLSPTSIDSVKYRDPYTFNARQLILPATLIVVGSSSLYLNAVSQADQRIVDSFDYGRTPHTFDDYLQYGSFALLWTLDACGVKSRHKILEQTTNLALSAALMGIMVNVTKYSVKRQRPNNGTLNSLPSGHTAMAFMGAEFLRQEYRDTSPWIGIAGYSMATTVGFMRVWNGRHWPTDVITGAGIGILSVRAAYWLAPCVNRLLWGSDLRGERPKVETTFVPYTDGESTGVALSLNF